MATACAAQGDAVARHRVGRANPQARWATMGSNRTDSLFRAFPTSTILGGQVSLTV